MLTWFPFALQFLVASPARLSAASSSPFRILSCVRSAESETVFAGIEAMQVINREVVRSVFVSLLLILAGVSPLMTGYALRQPRGPAADTDRPRRRHLPGWRLRRDGRFQHSEEQPPRPPRAAQPGKPRLLERCLSDAVDCVEPRALGSPASRPPACYAGAGMALLVGAPCTEPQRPDIWTQSCTRSGIIEPRIIQDKDGPEHEKRICAQGNPADFRTDRDLSSERRSAFSRPHSTPAMASKSAAIRAWSTS